VKKTLKKRSKNIFKYADEDNLRSSGGKTVTEEDEDAGSDTFAMFSDDEDSANDGEETKKDAITSPVKSASSSGSVGVQKLDLMIDLGQLSDPDGADDRDFEDNCIKKGGNKNNQSKDFVKFSPTALTNEDMFRNALSNRSTNRQVKPDHIPNLALDVDDDRSQSVAVSLAKSMCKEIDYQKEMEMIVQQQKPVAVAKPRPLDKPLKHAPPPVAAATAAVKNLKSSSRNTEFSDVVTTATPRDNHRPNSSRVVGATKPVARVPITAASLSLSNVDGAAAVPPIKLTEHNNKFKIINSTLNQVFQPKKYYK
jgi:hypothetical protein